MKKLLSIILAVLLAGIIPAYAATFEFTPNEIVTADLPSDWYMNDAKRLCNADGVIGYVDGKSYDEPITDADKASLDFLKTKFLNNIMLVEKTDTGIHLYEADTTSGAAFVFTAINADADYMFLMCVYQNKVSYPAFKTYAPTVGIGYIPGEVVIEEEEIPADETAPEVEEIPEEPKASNSIGSILSTDITTFIDGMPVVSYNVDGSTVVIVEDLVNYGFKVTWDPDARKLIASAGKLPAGAPNYENSTSDLPIGTVVGEIFATDIVTEINGREYQSYNMNGQTVVVIETLGDRMIDTDINIYNPYKYSSGGFKTLWDNDTRTLNVHCIRPGDLIDTWAGSMQIKETDVVMKPVEYDLFEYTTGEHTMQVLKIGGKLFVDFQKYMEILNITSTSEKNTTFKLDITKMRADMPEFTINPAEDKTDMLLPLNLIIKSGKSTIRSNNSNIAYYYKDGAIMVSVDVLNNLFK